MSHRGRGGWTPGASEGSEILGQVVVGGGAEMGPVQAGYGQALEIPFTHHPRDQPPGISCLAGPSLPFSERSHVIYTFNI